MNIELAESLARKLHGTYVHSAPVNPIHIALQLGIDVKEVAPNTLPGGYVMDGLSYMKDGKRFILVSSMIEFTHRRLTTAKLLGYHVLGYTEIGQRFRYSFNSNTFRFLYDRSDIEASHFASELLMPASLVVAAFKADVIPTFAEMAQYFGVSNNIMLKRLKKLLLV